MFLPRGTLKVFDFVEVRRRSGGLKVHFLKDHLLNGMSGINVIFEGPPRWVLSEHLAYELYEKSRITLRKERAFSADGRWKTARILSVRGTTKQDVPCSNRTERRWQSLQTSLVCPWSGATAREKDQPYNRPRRPCRSNRDLRRKSGEANGRSLSSSSTSMKSSTITPSTCASRTGTVSSTITLLITISLPAANGRLSLGRRQDLGRLRRGVSRRYDWYEMPLTMGMNGESSGKSWLSFGQGPFGGGTSWWRPPDGFLVRCSQIRNFEKNSKHASKKYV